MQQSQQLQHVAGTWQGHWTLMQNCAEQTHTLRQVVEVRLQLQPLWPACHVTKSCVMHSVFCTFSQKPISCKGDY